MRYAELFAGAGGLSLGLDRAGWECAFHAEIAEHPRRILKAHWPDTPLCGDVTELDGADLVARYGPIDLLSGGSPCQDLSVAGKRAGLTEGSGTRSSLFYEQLRIWKETGADLCLWENVDGARNSNKGADFAAVLSAFVGGAIAVPASGWRRSGVATGPSGIAAWRVFDAQFFGVPQRRARIFVLCSRTGRIDPGEVLSLSESVSGNNPAGRKTRQNSAQGAGTSADRSLAFNLEQITHPENRSTLQPLSPSLTAKGSTHVFSFNETGHEKWTAEEIAGSLNAHESKEAHSLIIGTLNGSQRQQVDGAMTVTNGAPRRLLPIECERLMDWPDNWTNVPNEKGKPVGDGARYKACGNGVVSAVPEWIGLRIIALNT